MSEPSSTAPLLCPSCKMWTLHTPDGAHGNIVRCGPENILWQRTGDLLLRLNL